MKSALTYICVGVMVAATAKAEENKVSIEMVFSAVERAVRMPAVGKAASAAAASQADSDYNALGPLSLDFEIETSDGEKEIRSVLSETFRPGMSTKLSRDIAKAQSMDNYLAATQIARSIKMRLAQVYVDMREAQNRYKIVSQILKEAERTFSSASNSVSSGNIDPLAALRWEIIKQRMETEQKAAKQAFVAGQEVLKELVPAARKWRIESVDLASIALPLPEQTKGESIAIQMSKYRSEALELQAQQEKSYFELSAGAGVTQKSNQDQGFVFEVSLPIGQAYIQRQRAAAALAKKDSEDKYRDVLLVQTELNQRYEFQNIVSLRQQLALNQNLSVRVSDLLAKTLKGYKQGLAGALEYLAALESSHHAFLDVYAAEKEHAQALITYYLKYKEVETL